MGGVWVGHGRTQVLEDLECQPRALLNCVWPQDRRGQQRSRSWGAAGSHCILEDPPWPVWRMAEEIWRGRGLFGGDYSDPGSKWRGGPRTRDVQEPVTRRGSRRRRGRPLGSRLGAECLEPCVEMHQTISVCTDSLSFHFNAAAETPSHSPAASQDTALEARE